jgi:L-threonylcarbamoyladenylate synthase
VAVLITCQAALHNYKKSSLFSVASCLPFLIPCSDTRMLNAAGHQVRLFGKTIVYPTDTVYGLGANPLSLDGTDSCFEIKQRDSTKPLPVLAAAKQSFDKIVLWTQTAEDLATGFWPGKLTIALHVRDANGIPRSLLGGGRTIGVRVPGNDCCRKVISACGGLLIGTSANDSGNEPFNSFDDLGLIEFSKKVDFLVQGECGPEAGIPSTIVDATSASGEIQFLRKGAITEERIVAYLVKVRRAERSTSNGAISSFLM